MTPEQLTLLADARLSDEARLIGLFIASRADEWTAIPRDDFRRLLHGAASKDRVGRALGELVLYRYVERRDGGRGADSFRFNVQGTATITELNVAAASTLTPVTVATAATITCAPPPITDTPPPPPGGREDDRHLDSLRGFLGPDADTLERFASSAKHPATWARDIWANYRPPSGEVGDGGGPEWRALFAKEDEETAVRVLAMTFRDYAEKGERYSGFLWRRYVKTAQAEVRRLDAEAVAGTGTDGRPWRGKQEKAPADTQDYHPKPYLGLNS